MTILCYCISSIKVQWFTTLNLCSFIFLFKAKCPILTLEHGTVLFRGRQIGAVAKFTCNVDSILVGEPLRTCISRGQWSGSMPECQCKFKIYVLFV